MNISIKFSNRKLGLFSRKSFLYMEKLCSTSIEVIGAHLKAKVSAIVYFCVAIFLIDTPDNSVEIFNKSKPLFFSKTFFSLLFLSLQHLRLY